MVQSLWWGFAHHVRPTYAGANMGHPCGSVRPERLEGKTRGIPHLAKNERDAPNFLYAALERTACAALFKGEPHEVQGTHETPQEIGGVGHPATVAGIEPRRV